MTTALVLHSRRHVDLMRTTSAACPAVTPSPAVMPCPAVMPGQV